MISETDTLETKRSQYVRAAQGYIDRALREGRPLRPGEDLEVSELEAKIAAADRTLKRARTFERDGEAPGLSFAKVVMALASSRGDRNAALHYAAIHGYRDAARALSVTIATGGGFAVPDDLSQDFIGALRPYTSVRKLGPSILPLPHGNLSFTRVGGATVGYQGENSTISVSQQTFGTIRLNSRKIVATVPVSNSLVGAANPSALEIVRTDLVEAVAATEDGGFLYGTGGEFMPRGLRPLVQASNVFTAGSTEDVPTIDGNLSQLEGALTVANIPMVSPAWILSTRTANFLKTLRVSSSGIRAFPEMLSGTLRGYPYAQTNNMPTNLGTGAQAEILFADFGDVVVGEWGLAINTAGNAIYVDPVTNQRVNAFSNDQTVVRVIMSSDICLRHDLAVACLTGVNY